MTNTKVYRDRLNKLADFLTQPNFNKTYGRFDIDSWSEESPSSARTFPSCGTAACAAGWATAIPSFRKAGFRLVKGVPLYNDYEFVSDSVEAFFGINNITFHNIFMPNDYNRTRRQVASLLRKEASKL